MLQANRSCVNQQPSILIEEQNAVARLKAESLPVGLAVVPESDNRLDGYLQ
jgi:hypothetical protein